MSTLTYQTLPTGAKRARLGGSHLVRTSVTSAKELLPASVLADAKYPVVKATASFENLNDDASINPLTRTYKCSVNPADITFKNAVRDNKAVEGTWVLIAQDQATKNWQIASWEESLTAYTLGGAGAAAMLPKNNWEEMQVVLKEPPVKAADNVYFITASVQDKATVNLHAGNIVPGQVVFADNLIMVVEYCTPDYTQTDAAIQLSPEYAASTGRHFLGLAPNHKKYVCTGAICQSQYF